MIGEGSIAVHQSCPPVGEATSAFPDYYLFALIKTKNAFFDFSDETFSFYFSTGCYEVSAMNPNSRNLIAEK